jgi:hypothetical protein
MESRRAEFNGKDESETIYQKIPNTYPRIVEGARDV